VVLGDVRAAADIFLRDVLKCRDVLDLLIDLFQVTDLQYILMGMEGSPAIHGQYLSMNVKVIQGQEDATVISTGIVDSSYNVYIYACTCWPCPSEIPLVL
jgi:hypothetical protein